MTWGELKELVEEKGGTDDMEIQESRQMSPGTLQSEVFVTVSDNGITID